MCARAKLVFAMSVCMVSCAEAYRMPLETLALRQTLDDAKALAIVNDLVRAKVGRGDGVYEGWLPERTALFNARVEGAHITFDTIGPQISASRQPELNCRAPTGELVAVAEQVPTLCALSFDLRGIRGLGISPTPGDPPGGSVVRPPGYIVYARESWTTAIHINVAKKDLGPLLAALTHLSPAARVVQGASITRPTPTYVATRPPPDMAIVSNFNSRLIEIDGQAPAPCNGCDRTLKPGAHQFRVQYWQTGFLDQGMEVALLPGGVALAGPALGQLVLLVRSRTARDLTATLLPGHTYSLVTRHNMALDDWYVELIDDATQAPVVSDRAAHCKDCGPREQRALRPIEL